MQVGGNAKAVRLENIIHPLIEFFKRSHYFYYPSRGAVADFAGPRTLIVVSNSFFCCATLYLTILSRPESALDHKCNYVIPISGIVDWFCFIQPSYIGGLFLSNHCCFHSWGMNFRNELKLHLKAPFCLITFVEPAVWDQFHFFM